MMLREFSGADACHRLPQIPGSTIRSVVHVNDIMGGLRSVSGYQQKLSFLHGSDILQHVGLNLFRATPMKIALHTVLPKVTLSFTSKPDPTFVIRLELA